MEIKRTFDFLDNAIKKYQLDDFLAVKRNGKWDKVSTKEFAENSNNFSYGLLEMGFKKGDKIATVSNNRPEWNFVDTGIAQIGAVHVPIYPTVSTIEYEHILNHSESKILIVSSKERYDYIEKVAKDSKTVEKVYSFDKIEGVANYTEIIELGKKNASKYNLDEIKKTVDEDDLCSIIYTSGTTGLSKGVMMTHKNFVSNVLASSVVMPKDSKIAISFLPLNHVFERMLNYMYQYCGVKIYYAESIEALVDNIAEINPHIFASVPRVLEKIYDKIYSKGLDLTGIKRKLFFWALELAQEYSPDKNQGFIYYKKLALANTLIFSKWRAVLGGKIKAIVSGGAALQPRLSRVFNAAKIPLLEGYGLTETAPVISVNRLDDIRPGTVGKLLDNVEVKIGESDEILFRGPNLMKGYYNDPKKTAEAIDKDGWFHTGDTGKLEGRILSITGRIKELFKLSTGKYISPQLVENKFKESAFIEQILVVGDGEKFCSAIVSPSFEFLHGWAAEQKIHYRNNLELIKNEKVIARYQREVDRLNKPLDKVMKIKKFKLVCEEWTPETGELSPTLKLKRRIVTKKYNVMLDYIYGYSKLEGHVKSFDD